jgi:hypothetical protein
MNFLSKLKNAMFGKSDQSASASGKVDAVDIAKVTRTGIIMAVATFTTYMLSNVKPDMFGEHAAIASVVIGILSELSLRFLKDNK